MSVPYRTFIVLGLAVGLLGAGYLFAPAPGAMPLQTPPAAAKAAAPIVAPTAPKPTSNVVASRPPVPLVTRTHATYFPVQPNEARVPGGTQTNDIAQASLTIGAGAADGGLPPSPDAKAGDDRQAKAAIELDGYKNVRGLEKGPDGIWRGRAMRGRTEITVRVDATGSVSAD